MTVEEALEILESVLDQGCLSKVQEIVFRQSWEGQSYQEIAISSDYEVGYITDVGSKLWQLLSKTFGKKVTKKNFHGVLKQHYMVMHSALRTRSLSVGELSAQASVPNVLNPCRLTVDQRQSWGEAVDVSVFYGRSAELAVLERWVVHDNCRLVTILGMGGIGKTTLVTKLAEQVQGEFKYLIWRSLRNTPSIKDFLRELILFLSHQQEVNLPETVDGLTSRLLEYLRSSRCLLLLDNAESLLQGGELAGRYRSGYQEYSQLLQRLADERHQSCLIIASREKPIGLTAKEGKTLPVRTLQLSGLGHVEAQEIFKAKGLVLAEEESRKLIEHYAGNPLALNIAATSIHSLFGGDVFKFLAQGTVIFGGIWDLLDQQYHRLSDSEKQVMYWLAIHRQHVTLSQLQEDIMMTVSYRELLEALESLQQRSLIEIHSACFTQQPVVMEYMNERLFNQFYEEIAAQESNAFGNQRVKASKAHIRDERVDIVLKPLLDKLVAMFEGKAILKTSA